jgi:alkylhydroperoxidase family enzyme
MARVHIPDDHQGSPIMYVKDRYATKIVAAAQNLSNATYQHSKLSLREFEGARARTAEINGCLLCQAWRSIDNLKDYFNAFGGSYKDSVAARGPAPDENFYTSITDWRNSALYSDRERTAIEYAERMGLDPQGLAHDESFWKRANALFSDDELVDLSYCIAVWMGAGRAVHVLGLDAVCAFIPAAATRAA